MSIWVVCTNVGAVAEFVNDEGIVVSLSTVVVVDDVMTETVTYPEDESYIDEFIRTRTTLTDPCN